MGLSESKDVIQSLESSAIYRIVRHTIIRPCKSKCVMYQHDLCKNSFMSHFFELF